MSAVLRQGGRVSRLDGGSFNAVPNTNADTLGAQIAQAVYGGVNP